MSMRVGVQGGHKKLGGNVSPRQRSRAGSWSRSGGEPVFSIAGFSQGHGVSMAPSQNPGCVLRVMNKQGQNVVRFMF